MTTPGIRLERRNKIAILTLNRPERLNAFNDFMLSELERITIELKNDLPRAVIITGEGKAFSAGADVNPDNPSAADMLEAVSKNDKNPVEKMITRLRNVVDGFIALPVPLIAAINGMAYGGAAELSVRCDMRVLDPASVICFSEVRLGVMPDWGGGPTLARLIGVSRAADLILTARKIEATEALDLGLVNRISPPGKSLDEAVSIAEMIAKNGPRAVQMALDVLRQSMNLSLKDALALEAKNAISLIASGECLHGVSAFLEKRPPEFPDIE